MTETNRSEIAKALGRVGGQSTLKKYGKDHFKEMVNRRWAKAKKNKTPDKFLNTETDTV